MHAENGSSIMRQKKIALAVSAVLAAGNGLAQAQEEGAGTQPELEEVFVLREHRGDRRKELRPPFLTSIWPCHGVEPVL